MTDQMIRAMPFNGRVGYKRGWRKIQKNDYELNIRKRLHQIVQDPSFAESTKDQAHHFLSTIVDEHMPSQEWAAARKFIQENKLPTKDERRRMELLETAESHAVFMACQACENLRERGINVSSKQEKMKMTAQIASAIGVLSELQIQLMGGNDDGQKQD